MPDRKAACRKRLTLKHRRRLIYRPAVNGSSFVEMAEGMIAQFIEHRGNRLLDIHSNKAKGVSIVIY